MKVEMKEKRSAFQLADSLVDKTVVLLVVRLADYLVGYSDSLEVVVKVSG